MQNDPGSTAGGEVAPAAGLETAPSAAAELAAGMAEEEAAEQASVKGAAPAEKQDDEDAPAQTLKAKGKAKVDAKSKPAAKADDKAAPAAETKAADPVKEGDEELSPAEKKLAERVKGGEPVKAESKAAEPAKADAAPVKAAAPAPVAEPVGEDVAPSVAKILEEAGLSKKRVMVDDGAGGKKSVVLGDFAKDYPDIAGLTATVAEHLADAKLKAAIDSGKVVDGEQFNAMRAHTNHLFFRLQLAEAAGANAWGEAHTPEFAAWRDKLPAEQQKLYGSNRVEDAVDLVNAYRGFRDRASKKAEAEKARAAELKAKRDGLHGASLDGSGGHEGGLAGGGGDDMAAAFAAEAASEDNGDGRRRR